MTPRFISPGLHGLFDYALDLSLVAVPLAAGFTGAALWLSVAVGATNATYSFLTAYRAGAVPLLPFRTHLVIDLAIGVGFALAPFALGFSGFPRQFFVGVGVGIVVFVAATRPEP